MYYTTLQNYCYGFGLYCKTGTVRIFAYSSTREQSNKRLTYSCYNDFEKKDPTF